MAGFEAFFTSLAINFAVFMVLVGLFGWMRPRFPDVFFPRRHFVDTSKLPVLPPTFWGWIRPLFSMPEEVFVSEVGLDGVMFLRFLQFGISFFTGTMLFGLVLVLPINATGDESDSGASDFDELDLLSMSNVGPGSSRLWAHLLAAYVYTFYLFYLLNNAYADYVDLRQKYYGQNVECESFALLVREIPEASRSDEGIKAYFGDMYDTQLQGAVSVHESRKADKLISQYQKALRKLERAWWTFQNKEVRPRHKTGPLGLIGDEVDSIDFWSDELKRTRAELGVIRDDKEKIDPTISGFVAFKSVATTQQAATTRHNRNPFSWMVEAAPSPEDVYWPNLDMDLRHRFVRYLLKTAAVFWLVVYWSIPVAFAASLGNLRGLADEYSFLEGVNDLDDETIGFLEGILPSLVLIILMALLPIILKKLAIFSGLISASSQEMSVMDSFFYFQIFNVFIVTTLSSSAAAEVDSLIDDPIDTLGTTIPRTAVLFSTYIIMQTLGQYPAVLLQVGPLILVPLKQKYLAKTQREQDDIVKPKPFKYGTLYPKLLLTFVLGFTYSTMYPLILPICAASFAIAYLVYRYMLLYVNSTPYEAGGAFWPMVFNRIVIGALIHHFTLMGVYGIKESPVHASLMIPLVVFTIYFAQYANARFFPAVESMSLEDALVIDRQQDRKSETDHASNYIQPARDWLPEIPEIPDEGLERAGLDEATVFEIRKQMIARRTARTAVVSESEYPDDVTAWKPSDIHNFCADNGALIRPEAEGITGQTLLQLPDPGDEIDQSEYLDTYFNEAEMMQIEVGLRMHLHSVFVDEIVPAGARSDPEFAERRLRAMGMPLGVVEALVSENVTINKLEKVSTSKLESVFGKFAHDRYVAMMTGTTQAAEQKLYPDDDDADNRV